MACWSADAVQCRAGPQRTADIDKDEALNDRQHNGQAVDGKKQLLLQIRTAAAEGFSRPVLRIEDFVLRPSHQMDTPRAIQTTSTSNNSQLPHMHHQSEQHETCW